MSSEELVEAYVDGRISRRTLIRRLAAAGVSVGAASAYAQLLQPRTAEAHHVAEFYSDPGFYNDNFNSPNVWGKVITRRKKQARKKLKVQVGVRNESSSLEVYAEARLKGKWRRASSVKRVHHAIRGKKQRLELKLNKRTRKALSKPKPKRIKVRVVVRAKDAQGNASTARKARRLR